VRAPYITAVLIDGPADQAGFEAGDKVLQINGTDIQSFQDIRDKIHANAGSELAFFVRDRDGQEKALTVTPEIEIQNFQDLRQIQRSYPQIGILAQTRPLSLESISMIDGIETKKNTNKARDLLVEKLDAPVVMELKTSDGTYKLYKVHINKDVNEGLLKPDSIDYDNVFLDQFKDNSIRQYGFSEALNRAKDESIRLILGMASLPFHAVPFDKSLIQPETTMTGYEAPGVYVLYKIFYLAASMSVFLGLINLIPLPSFDGGRIISILCDLFPNGEKIELYAQRGALTLLILSVIFANSLRVGVIQ
jgi:membrane-associated protease RseP (regulator of RpoE activity)